MKYICQVCGYIFDEEKEKKQFAELPETWKCPLCGASKSNFSKETPKKNSSANVSEMTDTDMRKLSPGQLAALCSNLARGCEKQYRTEESQLFYSLAEYFSSITPEEKDPSLELLAEELLKDIDNYSSVRATADANNDRGAARICVWGEKVTRMLSSLVKQYLKEGEKMLHDTDIWICTTCGFVYIGKNPPELCPVCKVPSWKFEKVDGRNDK